ncbi:unnamed protein product [Ilex paraguariensis]|uniref:Cyclin-dependent kinase inhibitor domain-containing protein n=1 Tax=Ilex paraguariensis TaxID=185542 RepID=A0ABC8TCK9_9AQUA
MKKCTGIGEESVMNVGQIGVRLTRARAALAVASAVTSSRTSKRRKVSSGKLELSSLLAKLRRRRRVLVTPQNSTSPPTSGNSRRQMTSSNVLRQRTSSDHALASYCSSNGSSELANGIVKFVDLEEEESAEVETSTFDIHCRERERREMTPASELRAESGELEPTGRPSEASSRRRSTALEKMPSEAELEEFFAATEKNVQKCFAEKYNYDIVKDVPLEGRYEWIQLKR